MHEPGKNIGPVRRAWEDPAGTGPLAGQAGFGDADLDRLLAELKAPDDVCPAPGFYAKVLERIDAQKSRSVWSVFLEPWFGRRLAVASAALMLIFGAALFVPGSEVDEELRAQSQNAVVADAQGHFSADAMPIDGSDQDKDAVLVNLVTYQEH